MEQVLRQCPLHGVRFTWRGLPLGRIEPQAYAEPVRRAHVAAWLLGEGAVAVASAEGLDSVLGLGEGGAGEACVSLACAALAAAPDLARVQACVRSPGGTRAAEADPAWILEVNLAEGCRALQPLLTTYGQQVLVRQGEMPIGALYLPPCEEPRSLGEVVYALLAQLQPSTWLA
jgi:hypothetical protein